MGSCIYLFICIFITLRVGEWTISGNMIFNIVDGLGCFNEVSTCLICITSEQIGFLKLIQYVKIQR